MVPSGKLTAGVSVLLSMALLGACAGTGGDGDGSSSGGDLEPITLSITDLDVETGISGISWRVWMDEVTEASDGKITFDTFYGGTLIPPTELVSGLASGLADTGLVFPAVAPDELEVGNWVSNVDWVTLPDDFPVDLLTGLAASIDRTFDEGPFRDELDELNLTPFSSAAVTAPQVLMCTKPVTNLAEADGLSARVGGQPYTDMATAIGLAPVSLSSTEVYEALQRGVVDCALTIPSTFLAAGLLDIGTDLMLSQTGTVGGAIHAFNKDSWDALPLEARQILWDALPTIYVEYARNTLDQYKKLLEEAEAKGVEVLETPELNVALNDYRDDVAAELPSSAPEAVTDPEGYMSDYEATVAETNTWLSENMGLDADAFENVADAYGSGSEEVDWDLYRDYISELLAPYGPK